MDNEYNLTNIVFNLAKNLLNAKKIEVVNKKDYYGLFGEVLQDEVTVSNSYFTLTILIATEHNVIRNKKELLHLRTVIDEILKKDMSND